jgi:hypothetical protein
MRKAFSSYGILMDEDKFIGISLGYDFCAEHEWGIDDLKRKFGIPEPSKKNMGIASRTITKCPKSLVFREESDKNGKYAVLLTAYEDWNGVIREELPRDLANYKEDFKWRFREEKKFRTTNSGKKVPIKPDPNKKKEEPVFTAWDGGSFGVAVMGEKEVGYLRELYDAFQKNNVSIARINMDGVNPFSNASLSLLITDRLPKFATDGFMYADKKSYDLYDYEEKIGMKKLKETKGNKNGHGNLHYFMACSPRWIDYDDAENREKRKAEMKTKYDIQYWINYSDDDNNYGWYIVEEIMQWLNGTTHLAEIRKG